jgi:hypothetical protein
MKRSQAFPSRYLAQADVVQPVLAMIATVTMEQIRDDGGMVGKTVMTFANDEIKPMILNGINWSICEAAYGVESDDWCGKLIEIYADPNVMYGRERVGGVRVRIPVAAPRAVAPNAPAPKSVEPTVEQQHARGLTGMKQAQNLANLDAWLQWRERFPSSPKQEQETEDQYHASRARIAQASVRKPATDQA